MHRLGELLTVSGLGLMVNLVGMTAFGHAHHGHGHSHGGDDHNHDHEHTPAPLEHSGHSHDDDGQHDHHHHDNHVHTHLHDHLHACPSPSPHGSIPATPSKPVHAHSHAHGHHYHHHGNENMHGIFLHILADTMGSVAVIISTLLIHFYGWSGFDPIASVIIAVLIFASAIPLVKSSARTLLLTIPEDTEFDLREALAGVSALRGVVGYAVPKFWLDEREERRVLGVIHVFVAKNADMEDVKERAVAFLKTRGMNVLVQVEREGSGRCWCRGGLRAG
jgi:zinc transporter 5/7